MSRCAVVDEATNVVANIIVADAAVDNPPPGHFLINTEGPCGIGWVYDPVMQDFVDPNPPPPDETIEDGSG